MVTVQLFSVAGFLRGRRDNPPRACDLDPAARRGHSSGVERVPPRGHVERQCLVPSAPHAGPAARGESQGMTALDATTTIEALA